MKGRSKTIFGDEEPAFFKLGMSNTIREVREVKMGIAKTFMRRAGMGIIVVFALLVGSAVSWGDTTIYVYQQLAVAH